MYVRVYSCIEVLHINGNNNNNIILQLLFYMVTSKVKVHVYLNEVYILPATVTEIFLLFYRH